MKESQYIRVITHVPINFLEQVQEAIGAVGAGKMGDYSNCSFTLRGVGYFTPEEGAKPAIGAVGNPEIVEEYHLEFTCHTDILKQVIKALKKAHPYEEVPIFIHKMYEI